MPGYGTQPPDQGSGLLDWAWAEERLRASHDYWLATVTPDGRPHVMPVWGLLLDGRLWFSSSNGSRKARNLATHPYCSMTTDNALEPVVADGPVELVTATGLIERMLAAENEKYGTDYGMDMMNPAENSCFALTPVQVIGLDSSDFTGSPTRWTF
jgi:nitroimidazol reductase NimA-like FMN-containing flavoprotein (pyridoxamine 5'-phosphate oxidase superfamily)